MSCLGTWWNAGGTPWGLKLPGSGPTVEKDYALITRMLGPATEGIVISIAGLQSVVWECPEFR